MYTSIRIQTIPRSLFLAAMLIVTFAIGGGAGYAVGSAAALTSAPSSTQVRSELELNAAFHASEHQGSAENPDAVHGPTNIPFLQSEHSGSSENPVR